MDELNTHKENELDDLLSESTLEMPFSDFEDAVMQLIEEKAIRKRTISKELKLSRFFFITGSIFGFIISILLSQIKEPLLGMNPNVIALIFQITFATLFFTQIETYLKVRKD
jgi:flagellar biosynthesis protein FliQ